ncbi:MAG: 5'/3'-nucleotidase SurE [Weeksellaceae bacterium]
MNSTQKPLILVTNDDGITAPGVRALIRMMNEIGEVYVIAPDKPQSGMGHAITVDATLFCEQVRLDDGPQREREWACSGTPVDCVKLAISKILPKMPDLCVSGINHGANSSINVIYSGTMSAAVEAGIDGIPAIGFSLCDFAYSADFDAAKMWIQKIVREAIERKMPKGMVLNVNIPKLPENELKGIKICRQARAVWEESYDERKDPRGRTYYWLTGKFQNLDKGDDTDESALEDGYLSVVPIQYDMTAYHYISELNRWEL